MKPGFIQSPVGGYHYLFGPVASRRFGRSLGVDIVPLKTCSFNCVFCEVGVTPETTMIRREYVPLADVFSEFDKWHASGNSADYVTVTGSGEPTLHTGFGNVLAHIQDICRYKTALLTNGTLFHLPEVRAGALKATVVKASLSAWDDASLHAINRPCAGLTLDMIVKGLRKFRSEYTGALWLEVFALAGINDSDDNMKRIAELARSIGPDRIHLNTVVRPPADTVAKPLTRERLMELSSFFGEEAEIIAEFESSTVDKDAVTSERVVQVLKRRPCTARDLAGAFGADLGEVQGCLDDLIGNERIHCIEQSGENYYVVGIGLK
ncbi:MAG: radical SAM protein [Lentisphaerae bacterium]|nr:radical SAM protein [Lentisphaerota bacterium]